MRPEGEALQLCSLDSLVATAHFLYSSVAAMAATPDSIEYKPRCDLPPRWGWKESNLRPITISQRPLRGKDGDGLLYPLSYTPMLITLDFMQSDRQGAAMPLLTVPS